MWFRKIYRQNRFPVCLGFPEFIDDGIDHDSGDPCLEWNIRFSSIQILQDFQEAKIKRRDSFVLVPIIPATDSHQDSKAILVQALLRPPVLLKTFSDEFMIWFHREVPEMGKTPPPFGGGVALHIAHYKHSYDHFFITRCETEPFSVLT